MEDNRIGGIGWSLIPPSIVGAEDLSSSQKIIWGRINGLKGERGYCFASNEFLGKQLKIKSGSMANMISEMVSLGYLKRTLVFKNGEAEILVDGSLSDNPSYDTKGFKMTERRLIPVEKTIDHEEMLEE